MPIKPANRKLYPKAWPAISQGIRYGRAGGRCECAGECGHLHIGGRCEERDGEGAFSHRGIVRLAVGHLDHDPTHNGMGNLKALCQGCHLRHDRWHHASERARTRRRRLHGRQVPMALVLPGPGVLLRGEQLSLVLPKRFRLSQALLWALGAAFIVLWACWGRLVELAAGVVDGEDLRVTAPTRQPDCDRADSPSSARSSPTRPGAAVGWPVADPLPA